MKNTNSKLTIALATACTLLALFVGLFLGSQLDQEKAYKAGIEHAIVNAEVYNGKHEQGFYYINLDGQEYTYWTSAKN